MKNLSIFFILMIIGWGCFGQFLENESITLNQNCEPYGLPYLESFDQETPPDLPHCWSFLTLGFSATVELVSFPHFTPPNAVRLSYSSISQAYLLFPEFAESNSELFVSFRAKLQWGTDILDVGILTNPMDTSTFILVETFDLTTEWNDYSVNFQNITATDGVIVIRYEYNGYPYAGTVIIDDIYINTLEDCPSPFRLGIEDLTDVSVRLAWEPFGPGVQWDVEWGEVGFTHGEGVLVENIDQSNLNIFELQENTAYEFYVRSHCNEGQLSAWSLPHIFQTYSSDECFYTFILHSISGMGWNYARMHILQDGELIMEIGQGFTTGYTYEVSVKLVDGLEFEVYWQEGGSYPADIGLEIINPEGEHIYNIVPIGWTNVGTTIFTDLAICVPPTCNRPDNLTVTDISSESALLNWVENAQSQTWEVEYGMQGFAEGEGITHENVTEKPLLITGLQPETTYEFRVRSVCNESLYSPWSSRKIFSTTCESFPLPFSEGFDNVENPFLPDCWSSLELGYLSFVRTTYYFHSSPPNSVEMRYHNYDNSIAMLILPPFQGDVSSQSLSFKALHLSGGNHLEIGIITNSADPSSFYLVESFVLPYNWQWNEFWVYFYDYAGDNGQIAIRFGNPVADGPGLVLIDDVYVESATSCTVPYNLREDDVTVNSAVLLWNDVGSGMGWELEWGIAPFEQGEGTLVQNLNDTSFALEGLTASTYYQFYVRALCSDNGMSNWSNGYTFATQCDVFNVPFTEGFDNVDIGEVPLCWIATGSENGDWVIRASNWDYQSPPHSLFMNRHSNQFSMLVTPELSQPIQDLTLSFYADFRNGVAKELSIGTISDPGDPSTFTEKESFTLSGVWELIEVSFDQYEGSDKHIAIKFGSLESEGFGGLLIDDVKVLPPFHTITLRVQDENQQPISGAEIEIEGLDSFYTSGNGEVTVDLHNGEYGYTAYAPGYESYSGEFIIENENLYLTIDLLYVSIEENRRDEILLYPNPSDGFLHVKSSALLKKLVILNALGQPVYMNQMPGEDDFTIDISHIGKGFYFVELYGMDGAKWVRKILIK